jgi:hypothetical protein
MINENVNDEETDIHDSAMKHINAVYQDEPIKTYDSNRSQCKTKRTISQRRSTRSVDKKKKKVVFKSPIHETIEIESYKAWTKKMYIMPSHSYGSIERSDEKCCENSLCIII